MAKDLVGLYNLSLSAVGHRSPIALPTEDSREARLCNRWFESVRDQILCAAPWASCRASALLALNAERDYDVDWAAGDPEPPWLFQYATPADFLYPRFLQHFELFIMGDKDGSPVIHTNAEDALLIYNKKQIVPSAWSADLWMAMVYGLAAHICIPLSGKMSTAQTMLNQANNMIITARVNAANENQQEFDSVPDWLIARGVSVTSYNSRYIYSYGPLLSMSGTF